MNRTSLTARWAESSPKSPKKNNVGQDTNIFKNLTLGSKSNAGERAPGNDLIGGVGDFCEFDDSILPGATATPTSAAGGGFGTSKIMLPFARSGSPAASVAGGRPGSVGRFMGLGGMFGGMDGPKDASPASPDKKHRRVAELAKPAEQQQVNDSPRPDSPNKFTVTITKAAKDKLTISVSGIKNENHLIVMDWDTVGPIETWNEEHPEACIQANDHIYSVNGDTGPFAKLQERIENGPRTMRLGIERPPEKAITIANKKLVSWGLGIVDASGGKALRVTKVIPDGFFDKWNQAHNESLQINVKDIIVEVNGIRGDSTAMKNACQACSILYVQVIAYNSPVDPK